ncbi:MarR family winged helix-turn-helix transcriptional regulator [Kribbella deserti]|uniref:MarR family winged helix-turn-helix transcriptional regulator n=1 Tax=Kribbella deserti TaxID=1926257 RepID=A0ABV6QU46_9ACTN
MTIAPSLCSPLALADAEPTRVTDSPATEPWDTDVITAYGLLREAAAELDHLMRHSLKRSGLQMAMFELLLRLARSPGEKQRLTSLARELTVTTGGITRLVDRAEHAGLVRREACPDDARGSFAVLTEEGKRRLREALPDHLLEIDSLWTSQIGEDADVVLGRLRAVRDNARRWPHGRPHLGVTHG